jgi:predicted transcriptional regulator YdeE
METIPASLWAVFPVQKLSVDDCVSEAYMKIEMEWFVNNSLYIQNKHIPHLEVYPPDKAGAFGHMCEIWMPVLHRGGVLA